MKLFQNTIVGCLLVITFLGVWKRQLVCAQTIAQPDNVAVKIGESLNLKSEILDEDYSIWIYTPVGYNSSTEKYPVIYTLDAKYYFTLITEPVKILSTLNGNGVSRMPACIVVGIMTNNRDRDFTPASIGNWKPPSQPDLDGSSMPSGGADKYLDHIEKEVIPFIESHYRTHPYRILIGHSLGGLLSIYGMVKKPGLFQAHIVGDPSMWWNEGFIGRNFINYLKERPNYRNDLIWFATKSPRERWSPIDIELNDYLNTSRPKGLNFKYLEIENERHMTVIYPGIYMAIRELYSGYGYQFKRETNFVDARKHYNSLSTIYNYSITIPEQLYNALRGHVLHVSGDKETALATCQEWIKAYPNSYLAYEMTGRTYMEIDDDDSAFKYLAKSLELKPDNTKVRSLIESLKKP